MRRQVVRAARRGDLSERLLALLPPLIAATQEAVEGARAESSGTAG